MFEDSNPPCERFSCWWSGPFPLQSGCSHQSCWGSCSGVSSAWVDRPGSGTAFASYLPPGHKMENSLVERKCPIVVNFLHKLVFKRWPSGWIYLPTFSLTMLNIWNLYTVNTNLKRKADQKLELTGMKAPVSATKPGCSLSHCSRSFLLGASSPASRVPSLRLITGTLLSLSAGTWLEVWL